MKEIIGINANGSYIYDEVGVSPEEKKHSITEFSNGTLIRECMRRGIRFTDRKKDKSIDERTKKKAKVIPKWRTTEQNTIISAYRDGATEQKEIDIDNACKEFKNFLQTRINYDTPTTDKVIKDNLEHWIEDFRISLMEKYD